MKTNNESREETLRFFGHLGRIAAVLFIGFSLFLLVSTAILIILTRPSREVEMPDIEGKRFLEVYNNLVRKGLRPELQFKDIADFDDGTIISQYPKKGTIVPENSSVKLLVSRSRYRVEVPSLIGKELSLALSNLKNIHRHDRVISLGTGVITYLPSDTVADGIVIDQSPRAGETVSPSQTVSLLVSAGKTPPGADMPGISGQSIELCYDLLRAKGLFVAEEIVTIDNPAQSGQVISQTPAKGAPVKSGDTATLRVAWAPIEKHTYVAYERVEYTFPGDTPAGVCEAQIEDRHSKRIRYYGKGRPGHKISFIFRREGNAVITFLCNKKKVGELTINVE